jgi:signal transduction histidine kinase
MQVCPWEAAQYFVYSSNIPTLFFYSHIPAIVVALLVGFLVFYKSTKSKVGITLLLISTFFSLWSIIDLILWATNRPDVVMFFWSMQILIEPLIYLLGFYLTYVFVTNQDLAFKYKLIGILIYLPIVVFLPTAYNLSGVTLFDCVAMEGVVAQYVTYAVELIFIIAIFVFVDREYRRNTDKSKRKEIITFGLGVIVFLLAFSWGNLIGSFTENWTLAQAGLIGMPIFVGFLAYLIVKYHTFNIKLFATQALVWGLVILIGSQFFYIQVLINKVLNSVAFLGAILFGYLLIGSVKREIEQREELQKLNIELENLIKQRESLMHLITHKVKGSFTHSKYIFAGMLDGTFGEVNEEVKRRAEQGLESNDGGIKTIDLVLNSANMQRGLIKYEMKITDFKDAVQKLLSEKKISAEKKGLALEKEVTKEDCFVLGDAFWLKEAANNLVENSIKYTKEGKISVNLSRTGDKILLTVKDTGIGITEEDKKNLFTEGGRGKESVKINVDSTGYGLYSVKMIVEAHKGRVWAESEGPGTGSTFYVELPRLENKEYQITS